MHYLDRMPTEMRVPAMRDSAARNRGIAHTQEFVRFGVEHAWQTLMLGNGGDE